MFNFVIGGQIKSKKQVKFLFWDFFGVWTFWTFQMTHRPICFQVACNLRCCLLHYLSQTVHYICAIWQNCYLNYSLQTGIYFPHAGLTVPARVTHLNSLKLYCISLCWCVIVCNMTSTNTFYITNRCTWFTWVHNNTIVKLII